MKSHEIVVIDGKQIEHLSSLFVKWDWNSCCDLSVDDAMLENTQARVTSGRVDPRGALYICFGKNLENKKVE